MKDVIARVCDMREGFALQLLREDDGDIIVSVIPENGVFSFDAVQICSSGTQSKRTHRALRELFDAMLEDEAETPQNSGMRKIQEVT